MIKDLFLICDIHWHYFSFDIANIFILIWDQILLIFCQFCQILCNSVVNSILMCQFCILYIAVSWGLWVYIVTLYRKRRIHSFIHSFPQIHDSFIHSVKSFIQSFIFTYSRIISNSICYSSSFISSLQLIYSFIY